MDVTTFHLPGTTEPDIVVRRSALGNIAVLVDGTPVKRRSRRAQTYDIPLSDGSTKELRLTGQWTGLKATVDGLETPLEPTVPRAIAVLIFVPLLLVLVGGLIGGLFGVGAAAVNARLSRLPVAWPVKVVSMLGVTVLAAALFFGVAFVVAPVPTLTVGSCVNGVNAGAEVTTATTRKVDCAGAHDNEVVGSVAFTGTGAYPGQDALIAFAQDPCLAAFNAYVGTDFQSSTLEMILVSPSDSTWVKGDRQIACVVVAPTDQKLIGTVKGTAK